MLLTAAYRSAGGHSGGPTGGERQAASRAVRAATIHWENVPLGTALARLGEVLDAATFVDRRVDPQQRVDLDAHDAPLDELVEQVAAATRLGVSRLGPLVYFGPVESAQQLRTLAALREEEMARLAASERRALEATRAISWSRLAEPRSLIAGTIRERGWQVRGEERIAHDLWPAGSLPELPFAEQLTVLLIGFDLTFRVEPTERVLEIVPIDEPVVLRRRYPREIVRTDVAVLQQRLPNVEARAEGSEVVVEGQLEDHERLAELLRNGVTGPRPRPAAPTKQVFTLRVEEQPVGAVLRELGRRLGWQLEIEEDAIRAAGVSLERRISFAVEDADQDQLLDALLHPVGLGHAEEGGRIKIVPRGSTSP